MWDKALWLGVPASEYAAKNIYEGDLTGRFAYYRCTFTLDAPAELTIDITANSRYRLWVNSQPVISGPCKGDLDRHYYESIDLTPFLRTGKNVLAAQVLYLDHYAAIKQSDERAAIFSVCTPGGGHRLAVAGQVKSTDGTVLADVTTGTADWRVWLDGSYYLTSQRVTDCMGTVCESPDFSCIPHGWKYADFDETQWPVAQPLETVAIDDFSKAVGLLQRFPIQERPIPLLYEEHRDFAEEVRSHTGLLRDGQYTVPAGSTETIILDAGAEVSGYPAFRFSGGRGSKVRIVYFEKFTGCAVKTDAEHGQFSGITDTLLLDGADVTFEPFWYRSFRFIAVEIEATADTVIFKPGYQKAGYPLEVKSWVSSSEKWVQEVWDICVRTLENCMMETYMDCPYYEQNQFPMDTRLQALFCGAASGDERLTMKALEDFHCSMTPDGLVQGRYPATYRQIISTFSVYYILMLEETWRRTGDIAALRRYLPDIDRILSYYHERIGSDGLVGRLGYWEFVDWQDAWAHLGGMPAALQDGPSTIINLMYALALEKGAALWSAAGRDALAEEYRTRRQKILNQVQDLCWDESREMYLEGPKFHQYSQHAQSWAVLNGLVSGNAAKRVLRHAMEDMDVLRVSFSTSFEWFRALEMAGMYADTKTDMSRWAALPALGNTTCPETPEESRSECHAWSALPIYEFIRVMAGIQVSDGELKIRPVPAYLPDLEGQAITPWGLVSFQYRRESTGWQYTLTIPAGIQATFILPSGEERCLVTGTHTIKGE